MLLELRFSICTLGLGAGTFLAALYGMNLKNFIEESDFGFWGVSIFSAVISGLVLMYGMRVLRRVQRVSMWGHCEPERGSLGGLGRNNLLPPMPPTGPGVKEVRSREEAFWGMGHGSAAAGMGPVGHGQEAAADVARAERARKLLERAERVEWHQKNDQKQHQHHQTRRRKAGQVVGENEGTKTGSGPALD
jgi:hypothetical protein